MVKKILSFTLLLFFSTVSYADDVDLSDTISGKKAPDLKLKDTDRDVSYEDGQSKEYPDRIYDGAEWLQMSPDFVWSCWLVMESLYKRDFNQLDTVLKDVKFRYPDSGIVPTGRALKWQVLMLENFARSRKPWPRK